MKKIMILLAASILLGLTSCGSSTPKQSTHTHEDGTEHTDHDDCKDSKSSAKQESFKVEADSTCTEDHDHDHDHDRGHDHSDHKH